MEVNKGEEDPSSDSGVTPNVLDREGDMVGVEWGVGSVRLLEFKWCEGVTTRCEGGYELHEEGTSCGRSRDEMVPWVEGDSVCRW